jgi:uncharacterized Zn-finger protein
MEPIETETVTQTRVACNGGGGPSGHPKVYLNLGAEGHVDCPYCGKRFVLKEGAASHAH